MRRDFIADRLTGNQVSYYGEVNGYLRYHIESLKETFSAPIYLLVRDGRKVIRSMYSRGTFTGNDISTLLGPEEGEAYFEEWKYFTRFEKICWYWATNNEAMMKQLDTFINFEDIINSWPIFNKYFNINITLNISYEKWATSVNKPSNASPKYLLPPYDEWNIEQRNIFDKHCKSLMSRLGYVY